MEPFVFAGNRRRWQYLRPFVGAATVGAGLWVAALCWVLLKVPALPDLGLGADRPTVLARVPGAEPPVYTERTPLKRAERPDHQLETDSADPLTGVHYPRGCGRGTAGGCAGGGVENGRWIVPRIVCGWVAC